MIKPGTIRVVIEVYDPVRRGYREAGMSVAGVPIATKRELRRLWRDVKMYVQDRDWIDRKHVREANTDAAITR